MGRARGPIASLTLPDPSQKIIYHVFFISFLSLPLRNCLTDFSKASFGRREWNGMEMNEKNNFRIFFPSLVWEFQWREWKAHSLI